MSARFDRVVTVLLAAGILGVVTSPLLFVFSGLLFTFSPIFSLVTLPLLALAVGYLLRRYTSRPPAPGPRRSWALALEVLSFLGIGLFLVVASQVNLTVGFARLGVVCTFFLVAWALSIPVVSLRRTALEQRVTRLPRALAVASVVLTLTASSLSTLYYWTTPEEFIG